MADAPVDDAWEWCTEFVRRAVADRIASTRRVASDTIKGHDRSCGADAGQFGRVLDALDRGKPVACLGWWPAAEPAPTTPMLGVEILDIPPPDRKGTELRHGHAMVILGYARHDAFAGGGYLVVCTPADHADGHGAVVRVPFTYVRAYASTLWTASTTATGAKRADDRSPPAPTDDDIDREIRINSRCADPSGQLTALFFSERAADTLRAKAICSLCTVRRLCLSRALERHEPYGVWGGEFFFEGAIVPIKRGRGRPSLQPLPERVDEITGAPVTPAVA